MEFISGVRVCVCFYLHEELDTSNIQYLLCCRYDNTKKSRQIPPPHQLIASNQQFASVPQQQIVDSNNQQFPSTQIASQQHQLQLMNGNQPLGNPLQHQQQQPVNMLHFSLTTNNTSQMNTAGPLAHSSPGGQLQYHHPHAVQPPNIGNLQHLTSAPQHPYPYGGVFRK